MSLQKTIYELEKLFIKEMIFKKIKNKKFKKWEIVSSKDDFKKKKKKNQVKNYLLKRQFSHKIYIYVS